MATSKSKIPVPTPAEFRLLEGLWKLKEATIDDLIADSNEDPPPNYKTVQTLLRLMENKKCAWAGGEAGDGALYGRQWTSAHRVSPLTSIRNWRREWDSNPAVFRTVLLPRGWRKPL